MMNQARNPRSEKEGRRNRKELELTVSRPVSMLMDVLYAKSNAHGT
jgi:hypothetical protein